MNWNIGWHYFGDIACLISGGGDPASEQMSQSLCAKLLANVTANPTALQPGSTASGEPLTITRIREIPEISNRMRLPWATNKFAHLDVGFVTGTNQEAVLTPSTLYLPWPAFGDTDCAKDLNETAVITAMPDLGDQQHIYLGVTMLAADALALAEHNPTGTKLPTSGTAATFKAIQDQAGVPIGDFTAKVKDTARPRNESFIYTSGSEASTRLFLQVGTAVNPSFAPDDAPQFATQSKNAPEGMTFDPWPCGAIQNAEPQLYEQADTE